MVHKTKSLFLRCCSYNDEFFSTNTKKLWMKLCFDGGGDSIQHPLKIYPPYLKNGDAFIINKHLFVVADGVSSVSREGFDPGTLPKELLDNICRLHECRSKNPKVFDEESSQIFKEYKIPYASKNWPLHLLARAFASCHCMGSTTVLTCFIDDNNILWTVNVGDCRLMHLRMKKNLSISEISTVTQRYMNTDAFDPHSSEYELINETSIQRHNNCPAQLMRMPNMDCSVVNCLLAAVKYADIKCFLVKFGDILMLCSDGISDNLFDTDVVQIINSFSPSHSTLPLPMNDPIDVVEAIIKKAKKAADPANGLITPFSEAFYSATGQVLAGGKPDDMTAIIGYVTRVSDMCGLFENKVHV